MARKANYEKLARAIAGKKAEDVVTGISTGWRRSNKGNAWRKYGNGGLCTIFPSRLGGYRFFMEGTKSPLFKTEREALDCADMAIRHRLNKAAYLKKLRDSVKPTQAAVR